MKRILLIALPFLLLAGGLALESILSSLAPPGRIIRLLALPPKNMELSNPLWDYQTRFTPDWKVNDDAAGFRQYAWEGLLDTDPETPSIQVLSEGKPVPELSEDEWNTGQKMGYRYKPCEETLLIGNYFFASDHRQYFGAPLKWDAPILEWEALSISNQGSGIKLGLALDRVWSASLEIAADDWTAYRVTAEGVKSGTYTLYLESSGTFSTPDKTIQKQFFIRNVKAKHPARVEVRLAEGAGAPEIAYYPRDPVRALLDGPAIEAAPLQSAPWDQYDESPEMVRPLEIDGIARTALFLPTPSKWKVSVHPAGPSDLVFYPTVRDPVRQNAFGAARLRVGVETPGGLQPLWEGVVEGGGKSGHAAWRDGIRVPLALPSNSDAQLVFDTEALAKERKSEQPVQPFYLGDPFLAPSSEHTFKHPGPTRPDVVLISIDTLRADAVSCLGGGQATPWMDGFFGQEGAVFTQAEAPCSWTLPSHASLFLSEYVSRHGVRMHYDTISPDTSMLAEYFAAEGYETAAFVDREFLNYRFGFYQGFLRYDQQGGHFASILPRCTSWLAGRDRSVPLFLFLHTYDVHDPYMPPEAYRKRFIPAGLAPSIPELTTPEGQMAVLLEANQGKRKLTAQDAEYLHALYLAGVAYVDDRLKEWITRLDADGLLKDPLVILVSDHGEAFREHGSWLHAWSLYEEETRIPILIHFPGKSHAGVKIDERASLIDVAPTLFETLGWKIPSEWQGVSFLPQIVHPETAPPERKIFAELSQTPRHLSALFKTHHKFIENRRQSDTPPGEIKVTSREAYDLAADPNEKENLAASSLKEATTELEQAVKQLSLMANERRLEGEIPAAYLDPDTIQGLQRINYLQGPGRVLPSPTPAPSASH
jgi:arylsulfatase A-like enzyme